MELDQEVTPLALRSDIDGTGAGARVDPKLR